MDTTKKQAARPRANSCILPSAGLSVTEPAPALHLHLASIAPRGQEGAKGQRGAKGQVNYFPSQSEWNQTTHRPDCMIHDSVSCGSKRIGYDDSSIRLCLSDGDAVGGDECGTLGLGKREAGLGEGNWLGFLARNQPKLTQQPFEQSFLIVDGCPAHLCQQMHAVGFRKCRVLEAFVALTANGPSSSRITKAQSAGKNDAPAFICLPSFIVCGSAHTAKGQFHT